MTDEILRSEPGGVGKCKRGWVCQFPFLRRWGLDYESEFPGNLSIGRKEGSGRLSPT